MKTVSIQLETEPVTFCQAVGPLGVALHAFALAIAAGHIFIVILYTATFRDMHRENIWIFLLFAALYVALTVYKAVGTWNAFDKSSREIKEASTSNCIRHTWQQFGMKGPYYTYKLYVTEIIESCNQINNVIVLYTCTMPQEIVFGICLVLFLDHTFRVWNMWQPWTIARRNRFVLQDTLVDFFLFGISNSVYVVLAWHSINND